MLLKLSNGNIKSITEILNYQTEYRDADLNKLILVLFALIVALVLLSKYNIQIIKC